MPAEIRAKLDCVDDQAKAARCSTHWSSRKLAAELGGAIWHMTVARV
jgi:hypothetical protein